MTLDSTRDLALATAIAAIAACGSSGPKEAPVPDAGPPSVDGVFTDRFDWRGAHAAVVGGGKGTTVFWNQDSWDVTGDTHAIAIMGEWSDGDTGNTNSGHAVYVHKATEACSLDDTAPCTAAPDDAKAIAGGDGSPGIGVVHLDEQDIVGARLRNPVVLSEEHPAIVRVRAPRFVTTGHWWEIALTPADRVIGAENTVVESQGEQDGLGDPGGAPNQPGKGAGPGHDPQEESFNVVITDASDFQCDNQTAVNGAVTRIAIKSLIRGGDRPGGYASQQGTRYNMFNPKSLFDGKYYGDYQHNFIRPGLDGRKPLPAEFLDAKGFEIPAKVDAANVADEFTLYLWQFEFRPSGVIVKADFGDGLAEIERFDLGVPWPEVHVHLMGVAYQNDHHPQVQSCWARQPYTKREIRFGGVSVQPVKFSHVTVFPPDGAPVDAAGDVTLCNGASCGRWMRYDMRDTHAWGAPDMIDGVAHKRPNPDKLSWAIDYAHGNTAKWAKGYAPEAGFDLYVPITDELRAATAANLVYNVLGAHGGMHLSINGHAVGSMPTTDSVPGANVRNDIRTEAGCPELDCMSVRRSIRVDPALLVQGATGGLAHLRIDFDAQTAPAGTFVDRLQLEVMR